MCVRSEVVGVVGKKCRGRDLNPRPFGLEPESSALDHSATSTCLLMLLLSPLNRIHSSLIGPCLDSHKIVILIFHTKYHTLLHMSILLIEETDVGVAEGANIRDISDVVWNLSVNIFVADVIIWQTQYHYEESLFFRFHHQRRVLFIVLWILYHLVDVHSHHHVYEYHSRNYCIYCLHCLTHCCLIL